IEVDGGGGDALYIGVTNMLDPSSAAIRGNALIARRCVRQGITIVDADGVDISYVEIEGIGGKDSESGINFEPNYNHQKLRGIKLGRVKISNCVGNGLLFYFAKLDNTTPAVSIDIQSLEVTNSGACHIRGRFANNVSGYINIPSL